MVYLLKSKILTSAISELVFSSFAVVFSVITDVQHAAFE